MAEKETVVASFDADSHFILRLKDYHAQEESSVTSDVIRIGPVDWKASITVHRDTHIRQDGRPLHWYRYLLEVSCLLPEDTKYYNCHATIRHGWATDTASSWAGPARKLPAKPFFNETWDHRFTNLSPQYRHRFTFDRGHAFEVETESNTVSFVKINLEHDMPPVRSKSIDFTTNTFPWQDLTVVCGPEEKELFTNKSTLAMMSPVFRTLLYGEFRERGADRIVLPDTSPDELLELLQHVCPNVQKPINESNIATLLRLADRYLMDTLTEECENYLLFYDQNRALASVALTLDDRMEIAREYRLKFLKLECDHELARMMSEKCNMNG